MVRIEIEKHPLRILQNDFSALTAGIESNRLWWTFADKIDDALGEYGALCTAIDDETRALFKELNREITSEPEPDMSTEDPNKKEDDPEKIEANKTARNERDEARKRRADRFNIQQEDRFEVLDEKYGAEVVTLDINETVYKWIMKTWTDPKLISAVPMNRLSQKINRAIDKALTGARKIDEKGSEKGKRRLEAVG